MPAKSQGKALKSKKHSANDSPVQPPAWPPLQPLVPSEDLALKTVLDEQIIVIPNLLTSMLCKRYVSFLSSLPLITTPVQPKAGEAVRVNDRVQYDDSAFAERLWSSTALKDLISGSKKESEDAGRLTPEMAKQLWGGEVVGLNPRIRVYRYVPGQFFGQHYDESNQIVLPTSPSIPAKTTWTLLIYLTGPATGCDGGETVFYPELGPARKFSGKDSDGTEPVIVGLEVGMALLHKHGQDCLLHEGRKVTAGEKWVIRSDLCVRT